MGLVHELHWKAEVLGAVAELSCRDLVALLNAGSFALISARAVEYRQLGRELHEAGYVVTSAMGIYSGHLDHLYIVQSPREADMVALGKKYRQDSVVIGEGGTHRMIFTDNLHEGQQRQGRGWRLATGNEGQFTQVSTSDGQVVRFTLNF